MLEILLILGVMVYIVWKLDSHHVEQVQALWREDAAPGAEARAPVSLPRLVAQLVAIEAHKSRFRAGEEGGKQE